MSNNWYIVDVSGDTQGPMDEAQLIVLYMNEMIHSKTYVWNGQNVTEWLPIKDVAFIYDKIKDHYINSYDEYPSPEPVGPTPTPSPQKHKIKSFSPKTSSNDNLSKKFEEQCSIGQELDAVIPYISEPETSQKSNLTHSYHTKKNEEFGKNEHQPNDENIKGRHINIPNYPSTLDYLPRDHRNADHNDLMANIRNGINLRDKEVTKMKQTMFNHTPKRLKDSFQANDHQHVEFPVDCVRQLHGIKQSYRSPIKKSDKLSFETPMDQSLISDVERSGLHRRRNHKSSSQFTSRHCTNVKLPFCNEVAERASLIRERFGEVEIASGRGRKEHVVDQHGMITSQINYTLKSGQMANRIARIKHELDQLTDNKSWVVTRIENVLFNASRQN